MSTTRILSRAAVLVWGAAAILACALAWRVNRFGHHVDQMRAGSKDLIENTAELRQSSQRLDKSVKDLLVRVQEQQAQEAPSGSAGERDVPVVPLADGGRSP